jgi:hypothetical protein
MDIKGKYTPDLDKCWYCGRLLLDDEEYTARACDSCVAEYNEILISEEARYFGTPATLQVWTDGQKEFHIRWANYNNIGIQPVAGGKTEIVRKADFMERFKFVRTTY